MILFVRKRNKRIKCVKKHEWLHMKKPYSLSVRHLIDRSVCCSSNWKVVNVLLSENVISPRIVGNAKIYSILHRPCVVIVCARVTKLSSLLWWDTASMLGRMLVICPLHTAKTKRYGLLTGVGLQRKDRKVENLAWSSTGIGEGHYYQGNLKKMLILRGS